MNYHLFSSRIKTVLLTLSFLILVSFISCGPGSKIKDRPPIPANAIGWVMITDVKALYTDLTDFWKRSGLEDRRGESLIDMIQRNPQLQESLPVLFEEIDSSSPLVMAILPPLELHGRPELAFYLPMRKKQRSFDRIFSSSTALSELRTNNASLLGNWAVITPQTAAPLVAPEELLLLPKNAKPSAIVAGMEVSNALAIWGEQLVDMMQEAQAEIVNTADSPVNLAGFFNSIEDLLPQLSRLEMNLCVTSDGLNVSYAVVPQPGSKIADWGYELGRDIPPIGYLDLLDAEALLSFTWSAQSDALNSFMNEYFKALGMQDLFGPSYIRYMELYQQAMGSTGAYYADLSISPDIQQQLQDVSDLKEIGAILNTALQVSMTSYLRPRSIADYLAAIAQSANPNLYGEDFYEILREAGFTMKTNHSTNSIDGKEYDSLGWRVLLGEKLYSGDLQNFNDTQELIDTLMSKLDLTIFPAGKDLIITTGGLARAQNFANGKKPTSSAKNAPGWKHFMATTPDSLRMAGKISSKKIVDLVKPFVKEEQKATLNALTYDGLYFWLDGDQTSLGGGYWLPMTDIKALVDLRITDTFFN